MSITNVAFSIPGEPVGKGRARSTRSGRHYTPAKTVAYEGLVALAARQAMGASEPLSGPLAVEIDAVCTIPASWSKKRRQRALDGLDRPTTKPDIDNICKAIFDGGNGVAWIDDKQIVACMVHKLYGAVPSVHVRAALVDTLTICTLPSS